DAGCAGDGDYNEFSMYLDSQTRANDALLHVFAAGNDGLLTCSPYPLRYATIKSGWQCSKNVLDVTNGLGFLQIIASTSSRGPVSDGRIKPEIAAAGNDVRTTFTNNTYNRGFGTSIAAPAVTGVLALLTERYKQLHGNANPKGALLKALLCNSADDMGSPGPDFVAGYGWMNAKKAVEDMEAGQYIFGSLSNGQTATHTINVPANTSVLKVMLYWNDAPASPASSAYLVNDLDLVVKNGGTDYLPWILNPSPAGVTNNATTGTDHLNNMEQVTINNPSSGSFNLQVTGFSVPQGAQDYVITYEFIQSGIELEYPNGGEKMLTDSAETIFWNASDGNTSPFTLEYSSDNGNNWTVIDNNIPSTANLYNWGYSGLVPTAQALMRISRNNTSIKDQSDNVFTVLGKPSVAISVVPTSGVCTLSNFDNDLKLSSIVNPSNGRKFTSTALSAAQAITVSIKNMDNSISTNNYTVSYRVNGGAIVTETPGITINAQQTLNYNFTTPFDFSTEGSYNIEAWVKQTGDTRMANDSAVKTVKQLFNNPVTLPFAEGFETAVAAAYQTATTGLNGLDRCDFTGNNTNSRARTYVTSDFAHSGSKSVTLDAVTNFLVSTQSNLITTVNLSNYSASQGLRLTFFYRDHQQSNDVNNFVWIRGNDTQPWIKAYDLNQSIVRNGQYLFVRDINVTEILNGAGQTPSSSFQIKFGEGGLTSANNSFYSANDNDLDDGYTFDDVTLAVATNDLVMQAVTSPGKFNCGLTNATSLTVSIKNTSSNPFTNIPVSYRINGGTIVTENVPNVPANTTTSFTFATTTDLSTPATYQLDVWIKNPSDDFPLNDSITGFPLVNNFTVNTFPYYEGFENGKGFWYSQPGNSSWEWGTPAGTIINKAANGIQCRYSCNYFICQIQICFFQ
ncbi:MAG: S8 family serine peptidase, partial [Sphingobacteriales bacterium]|nr:S8 family serine peptidase [Sphingobacteriales bacterium]